MSIANIYPPMRGIANLPWWTLLGASGPRPGTQGFTSTNLTASSTIHTPGAWSQLIASTTDETTCIVVNVFDVAVANTETSMLLDIGTGASGAEVVRVGGIAIGGASIGGNAQQQLAFWLPLRIPAGTRVAARIQSLIASDTCACQVGLMNLGAPHMVPSELDVLGTSTATSRGTVMTGASGTYTEVVASTTRRYSAIVAVPSVPTSNVSASRGPTFTVGVGAAGSEVAIGTVFAYVNTLERIFLVGSSPIVPMAANVPAGSRLAVSHDLANNPGDVAVTLIGVPA